MVKKFDRAEIAAEVKSMFIEGRTKAASRDDPAMALQLSPEAEAFILGGAVYLCAARERLVDAHGNIDAELIISSLGAPIASITRSWGLNLAGADEQDAFALAVLTFAVKVLRHTRAGDVEGVVEVTGQTGPAKEVGDA